MIVENSKFLVIKAESLRELFILKKVSMLSFLVGICPVFP